MFIKNCFTIFVSSSRSCIQSSRNLLGIVQISRCCTLKQTSTLKDNAIAGKLVFEDPYRHLEKDESWVKRIVLDPAKGSLPSLQRYVIMLVYCGKNYHGMCLTGDNDLPTIQGELNRALIEANILDPDSLLANNGVHFQTVSRTDAGVSALGQTVAMNLQVKNSEILRDVINAHLPDNIRILEVKPAPRKFNPLKLCQARSYSYIAPSYAFAPYTKIVNAQYRITAEKLEEVRRVVKIYEGTKYYRNFTTHTPGVHPNFYLRKILETSVSEPFIHNGTEFIRIKIKGESFILHQIRKMVGFAISVCRGFASEYDIRAALERKITIVPKAPSKGLVMDEAHFTNKYPNIDSHREKIEQFRHEYIYADILESEVCQRGLLMWLRYLACYEMVHFPDRIQVLVLTGTGAAIENTRDYRRKIRDLATCGGVETTNVV